MQEGGGGRACEGEEGGGSVRGSEEDGGTVCEGEGGGVSPLASISAIASARICAPFVVHLEPAKQGIVNLLSHLTLSHLTLST